MNLPGPERSVIKPTLTHNGNSLHKKILEKNNHLKDYNVKHQTRIGYIYIRKDKLLIGLLNKFLD